MPARNNYLDILKGVAMFLVIWGHCIQYATDISSEKIFFALPAFRFIYSFHMPLFTLVSGYLLGISLYKRTFLGNIQHKIQSIFWPILTSNLIIGFFLVNLPPLLFSIFSGEIPSRSQIGRYIVGGSITGYWFLWMILACSLASIVIFQKTKKLSGKCLVAIICWLLTLRFPGGNLIFVMFPFFISGVILGNHESKNKIRVPLFVEILIVLVFCCLVPFYEDDCFIYRSIDLPGLTIPRKLFVYCIRFGCGFSGSIMILIAIKYIRIFVLTKMPQRCRKYSSWISSKIIFIGENSLKFYILQSVMLEGEYFRIFISTFKKVFPGISQICSSYLVYQLFFTPLCAFAAILILYVLISHSNRYKIIQFLWRPSIL